MEGTADKLVSDLKALIGDTEALLKATANQAGEQVAAVRRRIEESLKEGKETLADAQRYKDTVPSVIGGDFNLVASEGMAAEVLGEAGFHDAVGSRSPTTRAARPRRPR